MNHYKVEICFEATDKDEAELLVAKMVQPLHEQRRLLLSGVPEETDIFFSDPSPEGPQRDPATLSDVTVYGAGSQ